MAKPVWFPFYVNDFLSSSKVRLMTNEERGGYILLLCHQWNDPQCSLADDDVSIRKLSELMGDLTLVKSCFIRKRGRIMNERLYGEWKKVNHRSELAYQSVMKRWHNERNTNVLPTLYSSQKNRRTEEPSDLQRDLKKDKDIAHAVQKPTRASVVDDVWIEELKQNPAYQHIQFPIQFGKMDAWLALPANRHRQKTRRFVLNWLNKIEPPLSNGHSFPCQARITDGRFLKPCGLPSTSGRDNSARCATHVIQRGEIDSCL